jgi:restriction system protein
MAEITRKRTGELLRKLFEILMQVPEGMPAGESLKALAKAVSLTDYEAGAYKQGGRRFEKIVRFATIDCVKAGWLSKHKGTWTLTDSGIQAYKSWKDPEAFYREAVRLYREWKTNKQDDSETVIEASESQDAGTATGASATITYEEAEEQAWTEIEQFLRGMPPYQFQELVASLLGAMGYYVSWISPPGKDGGVDIIAHADPLGTQTPRIKVQVKRIVQKADKDTLKSFLAIINDGDVGIFVATSGFTRDAEEFARSQERRKITLIDAERLVDLWIQFYDKLDARAKKRLPLTPIYFLTPQG